MRGNEALFGAVKKAADALKTAVKRDLAPDLT